MSIKEEIKQIIAKSLDSLNIEYNSDEIIIDTPKLENNGDYSTNIALILTKKLKKPPLEIANLIKENINSNIFAKVEIASPGFINIYLKKERLYQEINKILTEGKNYGKNNLGNNKKILLEYVSANPTGTLHIGHGRGATYGDNLSRIMSYCGYDVTREYYINDAGNQMNNLGISIKERYKELCNLPFNIPEDGYHGKEIVAIAKTIYDSYKEEKLTENIEYFKQVGLNVLMQQIKKDLDNYRVNFDVFTSEQSLYDKGEVENVLNQLKKNNDCYIKEDALWLNTSKYGDEKDRVIVKNDGNYTYFLPDIAYHVNKIKRGYQELIDVLGADHHGYINRLKASLEILGYDSSILNVKILQMVRLLKDGEEVKISKRTGKTITLNDLIDEVGINATRYFFASKSLDTQMDFDLSLAVKNSNENPVYYIEYANARIASLLNNYKKEIATKEEYKTIEEPLAYTIMNKLLKFTDTIIVAAKKQQPHIICNYVYELTSLFHTYYSSTKFITDDEEYTNDRIALLSAIKIVINNSLNLIGIIPREQM
ncbi:MAG: arginine--tRNA ligase [Erysipelotrichaceae bacterium]|nr:arginine--tRNA ligase [Erysipelotrichaceae bacterium]